MSESDSNNNPSKRVPTGVALPFPTGPVLAIAPFVVISLILGWVYFSGTIQLNLALTELKKKDHDTKAIEYLNWAIASNPHLAEAFAQRAKARMRLELQKGMKANYSAANGDIAQALKFAPNNSVYLQIRAEIEEAALNFHAAIASYSHIIDLSLPHLDSFLAKRAHLLYNVGEFDKARADRERIVKIDVTQPTSDGEQPLEKRAQQYVFLGETEKALKDYENCFNADKNPNDLLHMGYLYEKTGRPAKAIETYSQLIQLIGKDDDLQVCKARYRRANLYLKAGENEKALEDADHLIKHFNDELYHAFHLKILDLLHKNSVAQAERKATINQLNYNVDELFKEAPNDVLANQYVKRANFYAADQQFKKALKDYAIATTLHPESASYLGSAQMYTKLGNYDKAIELFGKAISPDSTYSDRERAYSQLAELHLTQHKPELAVEDCNKAIAQGGELGSGSYWRAKAYRELGKKDLAKIDEAEALGLAFAEVPNLD
ncbi:MAG: tetratricopeptide repeat protein [Cyanobacteria bacterium SZAS-4]|nr:tetratricopeptide repeat protein [Cyanobacteria bacterium SZAS-4]